MSSTRSTPVEMIANGDELFAEEEHALLLVRLRAVAFLLSAGLTLVHSACASANDWDARKAASWWEEFEPAPPASPAIG